MGRAAQGGAFALLQVTTGRARLQRRRVDNGTGRRGAGVGGVWWRGGGVVVDAGFGVVLDVGSRARAALRYCR